MSLLSAIELLELVEQGVILNVERLSINSASIDLHLGNEFLLESMPEHINSILDLSKSEKPSMIRSCSNVTLKPNAFCLAGTKEIFNLPDDISCSFCLNSGLGRSGLEHSQAVFAEAGWNKSVLTLELKNVLERHSLILRSGMSIGKMIFFRHTKVPAEFLYSNKGRYNGDKSVQQIKGD